MPNIMGKFKNMLKQPEEEMDYEDYYDDEEQDMDSGAADSDASDDMGGDDDSQSNVINIHDSTKVQFVLFKPESFDKDITTIADELIKRNTVILNVEQTNKDVARRIIDFLGGVAYAHNGKVSRVAEDTYIVMPSNVKLSGEDMMDEVESDNIYF